jgi:tripartite-type tricarboxylate transporter receptor subunit TctC
VAPAGTPREIIARLNKAMHNALSQPQLLELAASNGVEVVVSTPEELAAYIKSETIKFEKIIKDANIKLD